MTITPSLVGVPAFTGTPQANVDNVQVTTSAGVVQRQVVVPGDPANPSNYQFFDTNGNAQTKTGPGLTPLLTSAVINFSGSGTNQIIAGVVGKIIRVYRLFLVSGGLTNLTFEDNTTPLSGAIPLLMGGGITLDYSGEPWYVCAQADAFNINSSSAVAVGGTIYYVQQ